MGYGDSSNSVAPNVATQTAESGCKQLQAHDGFEHVADMVTDELAAVVLAWSSLPDSARQAIADIVAGHDSSDGSTQKP